MASIAFGQPIKNWRSGFTLVELMCVVAIVAMLASVATPSFMKYIRMAKTAEAGNMLHNIFQAEAGHYYRLSSQKTDRAGRNFFNLKGDNCNFTSGPLCYAFTYSTAYDPATGTAPRGRKARLTQYPAIGVGYDPVPYDWYKSFATLGVNFDSPTYFAYYVNPGAVEVAALAFNPSLWTYWTFTASANADLDGDGVLSTFLRVGYVNTAGEVTGGGGIYSFNPQE